jgi:hypothetical protein
VISEIIFGCNVIEHNLVRHMFLYCMRICENWRRYASRSPKKVLGTNIILTIRPHEL